MPINSFLKRKENISKSSFYIATTTVVLSTMRNRVHLMLADIAKIIHTEYLKNYLEYERSIVAAQESTCYLTDNKVHVCTD